MGMGMGFCCCTTPVPCDCAEQWKVVISGVTNGSQNCSARNGTFYLDYYDSRTSGDFTYCYWYYSFGGLMPYLVLMRGSHPTFGKWVRVSFSDSIMLGPDYNIWQDYPNGLETCEEYQDTSIPWLQDPDTPYCIAASSTCYATAL